MGEAVCQEWLSDKGSLEKMRSEGEEGQTREAKIQEESLEKTRSEGEEGQSREEKIQEEPSKKMLGYTAFLGCWTQYTHMVVNEREDDVGICIH